MVVPDDIYKEDVDFTALAMQHAGFAKKLKSNGQLDFSDPESVRQLTQALLRRDFNLSIELPDDRLCPPRLIDSTRPDYRDGTPSDERILGLDIGTGASAIYPLLACRQRPNWFFLATEIDDKSREWAVKNVQTNKLQSRIKVSPPDQGDSLLPTSQFEQFDDYAIKIQLTNPPFYASSQEMQESAKTKSRPANTACTGSQVEMITPGGEVTFVTRLIHESKLPQNSTKVQWFSSMLGKLSSMPPLIETLRLAKCTNYVVAEFVQGSKTRRWCVAWSWTSLRPPSTIARGITNGALEKKLLPFPSDFDFVLDFDSQTAAAESSVEHVFNLIEVEISRLNIEWTPSSKASTTTTTSSSNNNTHGTIAAAKNGANGKSNSLSGIGRCKVGDVWSRKARRQQQQQQQQKQQHNDQEMFDVHENNNGKNKDYDSSEEEEDLDDPPGYDDNLPLAFKISVSQSTSSTLPPPPPPPPPPQQQQQQRCSTNISAVNARVRWLQGHDSVLFESFCGWLKRKVESNINPPAQNQTAR